MLKFLLGSKKRQGKSVNDLRNKRKGAPVPQAEQGGLEARIKARKAKNLKMADVRAALASAGPIDRPDIAGAIDVAKAVTVEDGALPTAEAIDRALRLKGSARVIDETLAHPAWRYVALAIVRGLLEDGGEAGASRDGPVKPRDSAKNGPKRGVPKT